MHREDRSRRCCGVRARAVRHGARRDGLDPWRHRRDDDAHEPRRRRHLRRRHRHPGVGHGPSRSGCRAQGHGSRLRPRHVREHLDGATNLDCSTQTNTVLDCEKAATREVIADSNDARSPIARIGVVGFPSAKVVPLVAPDQFSDDLAGFTSSGTTRFDLGITRARDLLAAPSSASGELMVLLTDGDGTYAPVTGLDSMVIKAFTIAGAGCSPALMQADRGRRSGQRVLGGQLVGRPAAGGGGHHRLDARRRRHHRQRRRRPARSR